MSRQIQICYYLAKNVYIIYGNIMKTVTKCNVSKCNVRAKKKKKKDQFTHGISGISSVYVTKKKIR